MGTRVLTMPPWEEALCAMSDAHVLHMPPLEDALRAMHDTPRATLKRKVSSDEWERRIAPRGNPFMSACSDAPAPVAPTLTMCTAAGACTNVVPGRGLCGEPLPALDILRAAVAHSTLVACVACGHALIRTALVDHVSGSDTRAGTRAALTASGDVVTIVHPSGALAPGGRAGRAADARAARSGGDDGSGGDTERGARARGARSAETRTHAAPRAK
jgi:hypothetical protein